MKKIIIVALGLLIGLGLIPVIKNTVDKSSIETKSFTLVINMDEGLDEYYILDNNNIVIEASTMGIYNHFLDIDNKETLTSPSILTVVDGGENIYDNYILQGIYFYESEIAIMFGDGDLTLLVIITPSTFTVDNGDVLFLDTSVNNIVFQYDAIIEKPLLSLFPMIYVIILLTSAVLYIKLGRD